MGGYAETQGRTTRPRGLLDASGWAQLAARRGGALGTVAGPVLGGLVAGTARAAPEALSALVRGDVLGADRAIQRGISRQQAQNTQFRDERPGAAALLNLVRGPLAPLGDAAAVAGVRGLASQVRRHVDIERVAARPDGVRIVSEKMPYQPQTFASVEGLAKLGRPPGYDRLPPGVEYGIEIPKIEIANGDVRGVGAAYWRGGERMVSLKEAHSAHGGHPNNVGLSMGDRQRFDEQLDRDPEAISTVWSEPGVMALAMTEPTLEKLTRYRPTAKDFAAWEGQPLRTPGDGNSTWTPRHTVRQIFFDPSNRLISEDDARKLMSTYQQTRRPPLSHEQRKN